MSAAPPRGPRPLARLAGERRASRHTLAAYGADLAEFLGFLTRHLGAEPDFAAAGMRPADLRAFLAERAMRDGVGNATRARQLAAIRGFLRFLAKGTGWCRRPSRVCAGRRWCPRPRR
ncbi:site-specific integrase [Pseudoroseomonas cervicalis]|uniref:site-specific integrase n=1 Tax=Teichococcus cervicalis TaxID=204525 RepID=UPI0035E869F0